jgi:hypothetical protein
MQKGSFLVKEVCSRSEHTAEFQGVICTPIPLKEIFQVSHQLQNPHTLIGEHVIAYFGEILLKVFYIDREKHALSLIEQKFSYRGFIFPDRRVLSEKPCVNLRSKVLDVFAQIIQDKEINVSGIISTNLTLTIEKEFNSLEMQSRTGSSDGNEISTTAEISENLVVSSGQEENFVASSGNTSEDELFTKVNLGSNQDLTIVLE